MVSKYSDAAIEKYEEDRLGFKEYAEGVITTIEDISKEDTPFTIGIFGSWGSGKTSFMRIINDLLEIRDYQTIFFNSWEYGNEEKPWIPFMIKVVNALFGGKKGKIDRTKLIQNIFLFSTDLVLQHYSHGKISTGHIWDLFRISRKTSSIEGWSNKDTNTVIERVTKIDEFKDAIKVKASESSKGKIIIFIDDLDRIPEKSIDFLNSLKVFLDIKGCIFVLGCDYEILKDALNEKHKEAIYEDYFDKIVQAEFYIPKISERAIREYLEVLTGWSDDGNRNEIEEGTQLVIHSIGGNPRKIKRVVNETKLLRNVFEAKLGAVLQEFEMPKQFERPKQMKEITPMEYSWKGVIEEPAALKYNITDVFTPARVFDILFDRILLFKLVCIREEWPDLYEQILSEEKMQNALISLQDADAENEISEYMSELVTSTKRRKEILEGGLLDFLRDTPEFHGIEDIKTYLTLLEISTPETGKLSRYEKPWELPITLFNRYMMFERINSGKVEEEAIEEKINWKGSIHR